MFTVSNTVIAGNSAPTRPDCSGTFISLGHNLLGDVGNCSGFGVTGDLLGTVSSPIDPMLSQLGSFGGETDTHEPFIGSPVIDAGNPTTPGGGSGTCPEVDQRLAPRPIDGDGSAAAICDIGAHEAGTLFVGGFETEDMNRWSSVSNPGPRGSDPGQQPVPAVAALIE